MRMIFCVQRIARQRLAGGLGRTRFAIGLLAVLGAAAARQAEGAQMPTFNPKAPLQFYEMARRQNLTDASCAETARTVERVISVYGKTAPQFVPAWQLRLGDSLWAAGKEREAIAAYGTDRKSTRLNSSH